MRKQDAIQLLGGTTKDAAQVLGVTFQAVSKWPDPLSDRIADRVRGAAARMQATRQRRSPARKQRG